MEPFYLIRYNKNKEETFVAREYGLYDTTSNKNKQSKDGSIVEYYKKNWKKEKSTNMNSE